MAGRLIGEGAQPLICTPLVARTRDGIRSELSGVLAKKPDIVEWRADFFAGISDTAAVIEVAQAIKGAAGDIPVIFTIRSVREGGQPISLSARAVIELDAAVCRHTGIEYVDCELSNRPEDIEYLRDIARKENTRIIGSYHNFECTPDKDVLRKKFDEAEHYGLDVAKVAVMPRNMEDVLTLLSVTLEAKKRLKIPLITMSMGGYGAVSRMVGGVFGSSLTFAVGQSASAPGQIPIEDLRMVLGVIEKSMGM